MDVDRGAYLLVELIKAMGIVNINDLDKIWFSVYDKHINHEVIRIIEKLLALEILEVMPNGLLNKDYEDNIMGTWCLTVNITTLAKHTLITVFDQ